MAQYHFAATLVCRSKGQSAVAAAAYRAGELLEDERTGRIFDFTRKRGVEHTEIRTPANTPDWMCERGPLWNGIQKAEKRKDSQLARSIDIALPHELTLEQNLELVRGFVDAEYVSKGMIADFAIHAPGRKGDIRNVHVHILLTTREIAGPGFGPKARTWNRKQELERWREAWANHANRILEREGFEERIDHRSLVDQGIDREPTTHVGPNAKEMDERGEPSDRAQQNRDIKADNDNLALLKKELADSEKRLAELRQQLAAERIEQIQKTVKAADAFWNKDEGRWPPAPERPPEPPAPPTPPEPQPPRGRPSAAERIEQTKKTVKAAKDFWENPKGRWPLTPERPPEPEPPAPPTQPLPPQDASKYPDKTPPPVSAGGKVPSMPDDLSKQHELAAQQDAERQKQAQDTEKARQEQAAKDEADRLQKLRDDENKRIEQLAKQNAEQITARAEHMRQEYAFLHSDMVRRAQFDSHNAELYRRAEEQKRKEEIERRARLEEKAKEGPVREASSRYNQALGQHYDIRDPYGSLAKSAMAEYAAFNRDREAYDQKIARTADPVERQALDLRKRIEGADYLALTGDRIATMSEIITGRRDSQEAVKERQKATNYRIEAQDLRQQLRDLQRGPTPEKDRERDRDRSEPKPQPTTARHPRTHPPNLYDELIKKQDEIAKAKEKKTEQDPARQKELERQRELKRKRDRER